MSFTQQLIQQAQPHCDAYINHDFVQQLEQGTLPLQNFQHYLKQDYLYLLQYNRAFALAIYKADNFKQMEIAHQSVAALLHEIQLHIGFCKEWGIEEKQLLNTPESAACVAYTRLCVGLRYDGRITRTLCRHYALCHWTRSISGMVITCL